VHLHLLEQGGRLQPVMRIRESPALEYRGVMIDTARHFLSVGSIRRTIDMMLLSKLNYLHWHIADDESFPL
jgi:hexosaminidase